MTKYLILFAYLLSACLSVRAQVPQPAEAQSIPLAITNATVHVGNGDVIENGTVAFTQGKLTFVGNGTTNLDGHQIIDARGKHVYPGMILPVTPLGLVDINAVRPTRDYREVGDFKPHVRSLIAYNTDSELIATLRFNGILLAQSTPTGGGIAGTSSIMMLEGWNWEDAVYKADDGLHLNWPARSYAPRWWLGEISRRINKNYDKQVEAIKRFFEDAEGYKKGSKRETNLMMEATVPALDGLKTVFVNANHGKEIVDALQYLTSIGLEKIVLVGGRDAWKVADLLKEKDIPVLLGNVHDLPYRDDEDIDLAYKMPAMLYKEGVKVGLTYTNLQSSRNLPFFAGTASAYGLTPEEALKMVTSNTAEILGIGETAGTLEAGKDAILFVSEGDVLDMRTSKLTHAFIQGKQIELQGKQQLLYNRFKEKYGD